MSVVSRMKSQQAQPQFRDVFRLGGMTPRDIFTHFTPVVVLFLVIVSVTGHETDSRIEKGLILLAAILSAALTLTPWIRDLFIRKNR